VSKSDSLWWKLVVAARPVGSAAREGESDRDVGSPEMDEALAVGGRSSGTVDCLFAARLSSSSSSAISINRRLLKELVEEEIEPEAVCREQAADSVVSRRSLAVVIGNTVS